MAFQKKVPATPVEGVMVDSYLKALSETGYRGYLTIEREVGEDPTADMRLAVDFLRARL